MTYLNLSLNVLNGVRRLHLEGDGLAGQSFDEDLHDCFAEIQIDTTNSENSHV